MRRWTVVIAAGVLLGCGNPYDAETPALGQEGERDGAVELRVGRSVTVNGVRIAFVAVPEDSRCPRSVVCAWMGNAVVQLSVREGGGDEVIRELHTHPDFGDSAGVGGLVVRLVELRPYPEEPGVIPQDDYVATLAVTDR